MVTTKLDLVYLLDHVLGFWTLEFANIRHRWVVLMLGPENKKVTQCDLYSISLLIISKLALQYC